MSKETAFQIDMFTGEMVDNRSAKQKQQAKERDQPKQIEMFSQRDMAQFGVQARPKLSLSVKTRLELIMEDPRTAEEKERDLRREIEANTYPLPIWEAETAETEEQYLSNSEPYQPTKSSEVGAGKKSILKVHLC